jgi:signal transduction histidine kinase
MFRDVASALRGSVVWDTVVSPRPWSRPARGGSRVVVALGWLAIAAGVVLLVSWSGSGRSTDHLAVLRLPLELGPLLFVWWRPVSAWRIAWVTALVLPLVTDHRPDNIDGYVALIIVAAVTQLIVARKAAITIAVISLVPLWLWTAPRYGRAVTNTVVLAALVTATQLWGYRQSTGRLLGEHRAAIAASEMDRFVLEERARIAREMHDVVAHHMSLIVVQAESAPYRVQDLSEGARNELRSLAESARKALDEMRDVLSVLRSDEPIGTAPQPGIADITGLVANARAAGSKVSLTMDQSNLKISAATGICVYRLVQEALSNAARHAPGQLVDIGLTASRNRLVVRITNRLAFPTATCSEVVPGHGIIGMRERVAGLRGTLEVGKTDDGQFVVAASLPRGRDQDVPT